MSNMLSLNCLILGDSPGRIFDVEIEPSKTVGVLRGVIKDKMKPRFDDIDADEIVLWKVSLPDDDSLEGELKDLHRHLQKSLRPSTVLQQLFSESPKANHLHIIIQRPTAATQTIITLNCLTLGDDPNRVFPVEIAPSKSVSFLRKVIKDRKKRAFNDIDADEIVPWKVKLTGEEASALQRQECESGVGEKLNPMSLLSNVFADEPKAGFVHIIVWRPAIPLRLTPLALFLQNSKKFVERIPNKAPSSMGRMPDFQKMQENKDQAIFWNRPPSAAYVVPITLFHPIFGTFIDNCETCEPTDKDNLLALVLSQAMSHVFHDKAARASTLREILRAHKFAISGTKIEGTEYHTDGDMQYNGFRYVILELENEIGTGGGAEPHAQAILHYEHSMKNHVPKPGFRFPCILISVFGPYINFSGAVWTTRPHAQVLSPALPFFHHHTDIRMRAMTARHFGALRRAVGSLQEYYEKMEHYTTPPSSLNLEYPYPCSYTCIHTTSARHFTYRFQADDKLLFLVEDTDGKKLCVKFANRYCKEAHQYCASNDFAPELHGFETLPGGWYMIVMEIITDDYICLDDLGLEPPYSYSHYEDISQKITAFHEAKYVHGDFRATNIMVKNDGSEGFKVVDFDWSGRVGEVRYPMNVNRGVGLWRPAGARDGQLIRAAHDIERRGTFSLSFLLKIEQCSTCVLRYLVVRSWG